MKISSVIGLFAIVLSLNACWIGDIDDVDVQIGPTVIEVLCQNPETSIFCELAYRGAVYTSGNALGAHIVGHVLGQAGRGDVDPITGERCVTNVKSVFAPSDSAFLVWLEDFPQWETIYDIPADTVDLITKHHIFLSRKLYIDIDNPVCSEREIISGNQFPYNMMYGQWIFLRSNLDGTIRALTLTGTEFTNDPIFTPDITTSDGVVYILNEVLTPF